MKILELVQNLPAYAKAVKVSLPSQSSQITSYWFKGLYRAAKKPQSSWLCLNLG